MGVEVVFNRLVQADNRAEDASLQTPLCQRGEQALNGVDSGRVGRGEVDVEMCGASEPTLHCLGLVGGVVVEGQVQVELSRDLPVDQPQEADELGGAAA